MLLALNIAFILLRYIFSISQILQDYFVYHCETLPKKLSASSAMIMCFLFLVSCGVLFIHLYLLKHSRSLESSQLDHGTWLVWYLSEFYLPGYYWEIFHLCVPSHHCLFYRLRRDTMSKGTFRRKSLLGLTVSRIMSLWSVCRGTWEQVGHRVSRELAEILHLICKLDTEKMRLKCKWYWIWKPQRPIPEQSYKKQNKTKPNKTKQNKTKLYLLLLPEHFL